jgi:hypothetical protein
MIQECNNCVLPALYLITSAQYRDGILRAHFTYGVNLNSLPMSPRFVFLPSQTLRLWADLTQVCDFQADPLFQTCCCLQHCPATVYFSFILFTFQNKARRYI